MVIRCFFFLFQFHLKIGSHFIAKTTVTITKWSKLVIGENNHHKLSRLQVHEGNQCILCPQQESLQNYKKKLKYISCYWYPLFFFCNQCFMACFSILNYTLLFSCFNSSYDCSGILAWSRAVPQRKKVLFSHPWGNKLKMRRPALPCFLLGK